MKKLFRKNQKIKEGWVGQKLYVYNGKTFQRKTVNLGMVGHKVGEFILTKRLGSQIHVKKEKKKKKGKKK